MNPETKLILVKVAENRGSIVKDQKGPEPYFLNIIPSAIEYPCWQSFSPSYLFRESDKVLQDLTS